MAARHHILVVVIDRDAASCKAMCAALEDRGYRLQGFTSREDALKSTEKTSYQVAIVDLGQPVQQAVETVAKLRQVNDRMCCIAVASDPNLPVAIEVMRSGACDFLSKPVKPEVLIAAVERACRKLGLIYLEESELNVGIGQRIREERLRKNLTLRQLSDHCELTTSQLSQVELGKNAASIWALARISNGLGLPLHLLLRGL